MKKTKLAAVLKSLLLTQRISESELARQTGIGQPVIHRMASGETDNPKIETLRPIAKYFAISVDQLIGDNPLPKPPLFHVENELYNVPLITLDTVQNWLQCHNRTEATKFVQTDLKMTGDAYAIALKDSSMNPMFPVGTVLFIEPSQLAQHWDFVIVQPHDDASAAFKQLLIDGQKRYLKSINPNLPAEIMRVEDEILGVMLQARIDFRRN